MAQSVDPDNFFQTSDSLAERERKAAKAKNENGSPIRLPTKILAAINDPEDENRIYVSGSDGTVRRVDLKSRSSVSFTGPTSPLPCLAFSTPSPDTIYAGSWSKHIYSWDTKTRKPRRTIFNAHGDFVKALVYVSLNGNISEDSSSLSTNHGEGKRINLLISASADRKIAIWDAQTGSRLLLLRGHNMSILDLAIDPDSLLRPKPSSYTKTQGSTAANWATNFDIWSASSDREIRRWTVDIFVAADGSLQATEAQTGAQDEPLTPLPSSINQIQFTPALDLGDDDHHHYDGTRSIVTLPQTDLLAASASGATVLLSRARFWSEIRTFSHGEQNGVRTVASSLDGNLLAAAGRDEDVWIWNIESEELVGRWRGHADEIVAVLWIKGGRVISAGLDGTIRCWHSQGGFGREQGWIEGVESNDGKDQGIPPVMKLNVNNESIDDRGESARKLELTAEEEAELAELMESD